jgi:DNA-binding transcriptional ArsR family regulator
MKKKPQRQKNRSDATSRPRAPAKVADAESTIIWGGDVESGDFIKVPRTVLALGRYGSESVAKLRPRHIVLLLALAARKYQKKEIRAYWQRLAEDLGVSVDTVRKWGYELRDAGLIRIKNYRRRESGSDRLGTRNDRNGFDIEPFVKEVARAFKVRDKDRRQRRDDNGAAG